MIQANELRVGNWVGDDSPACPVYRRINADLIKYVELNGEGSMFAVSITPEILEKAGFVKRGDEYSIHDLDIDLDFTFGPDGLTPNPYYTGQTVVINIKYVHQLQNLYFALTGYELNISL